MSEKTKKEIITLLRKFYRAENKSFLDQNPKKRYKINDLNRETKREEKKRVSVKKDKRKREGYTRQQ